MALFYAAKGVSIDRSDPLKEALQEYAFDKERLLRFAETMCLVAAGTDNSELIIKMIKMYEEELFPERKGTHTEFTDKAKDTFGAFGDKAFVLSGGGSGASAQMIPTENVSEVFKQNKENMEKAHQELRERWKKVHGVYPDEDTE